MIFLEVISEIEQAFAGGVATGGVLALIMASLILSLFVGLALYIYMALAWSAIAKRLHYKKPWIAWIPIINFFLLPILAKKHWAWGFIFFVPIVNIVFTIFWLWEIYERRGFNGLWSLVILGSFVHILAFAAFVANLILFGMLAWSKD